MAKPRQFPAKLRGRLAEMRLARQMEAEDKARAKEMKRHRREGASHPRSTSLAVMAAAVALVGRR
jgi:hypothetical protein